MTKIKDIMTKKLVTASPSATLQDIAKLMKKEDIGNILISEGDKISGIITDRDIVIRAVAEGKDCSCKVSEFCTCEISTLDCECSVEEAAKLMAKEQIRRLPITEKGKVVGIISLADLATRTEGNADAKALAGISRPESELVSR